MGEPKHTPGPWRIQHEIESGFNTPKRNHTMIYTDADIRRSRHVAEVITGPASDRDADARLIVAAPSMLHVLQQCVIRLDAVEDSYADQVRRVIETATGEDAS